MPLYPSISIVGTLCGNPRVPGDPLLPFGDPLKYKLDRPEPLCIKPHRFNLEFEKLSLFLGQWTQNSGLYDIYICLCSCYVW